jgi:SAM-dependent methyltransferase
MADVPPTKNPVAGQYEKWVYPQPIMNLSDPEVRGMRDSGDPGQNFHTYWPDQPYRDDLDILIAGCGSNAAARYAFNHPKARVTGLDFSASSLAHEAYLKDKHRLDNLTLHHGRIEDVASLGKSFDFIEASGVLHHLPDPAAGLRALGSVLRPEGTIAIMVYGLYGRAGVYMLQDMFRLLDLGQDEADLATVKQTLAALPKRHVVHEYVNRTRDTKYDAGLVDTFLHRQDKAYTVAGCLDLVRGAGLSFMGWWDNILYYPEGQIAANNGLHAKVNDLPEESIWQFMELYNGTLGQHQFCVCHSSRRASSYRIDFNAPEFFECIPVRRAREIAPAAGIGQGCITVQRQQWPPCTLNPAASAMFKQIDGIRSVRECAQLAGLAERKGVESQALCRAAFQQLWRLSSIFLHIPG